jgi:alkylation response protein AidB-like acyl-CoA dehydrogenase
VGVPDRIDTADVTHFAGVTTTRGVAPIVLEARRLVPLLQRWRGWADEHARMAREVVDAAGRAGMFRLSAPREVGGVEASLPEQLAVYEELGRGDPNVAWCAANAAVAGRAAVLLDDAARRQVFADRDAYFGFSNVPGGTTRRADGGQRVTGTWPVVSGAHDAAWSVLGVIVTAEPSAESSGPSGPRTPGAPGGGGPTGRPRPDIRWALIPQGDVEVVDTWSDAGAMRGTGSHELRTVDAFVPDSLIFTWDRPGRTNRALQRLGGTSATNATAASIALGVLRSAIDTLVEVLATRTSTLDGSRPRDWPNLQQAVADLSASWRAARAGLAEAGTAVWEVVTATGSARQTGTESAAAERIERDDAARRIDRESTAPDGRRFLAARAELFAAANLAVDTAVAGVSRAYVCGTADAVRRGHPLDLALRDVHGMAVNWERLRRLHYDAGRVLLGQDPQHRSF